MDKPAFKLCGIFFAICGLAALAVAIFNPPLHVLAAGVAFACFLISGSVFSNANRLSGSLRPFLKKSVRVEAWGMPLPASNDAIFEIDSVSAFGAGLLIYLRPGSGGRRRSLLKVAQPRSASVGEGRIEIGEAAYVSWAGTKIKRAAGTNMPALKLVTLDTIGVPGRN